MTDHAAALTYYALMSLFPALLFAMAVLGVFGEQALVDDIASLLRDSGVPADTVDPIERSLKAATENKGTAAGALALGLVTSLYGASGAFGAVGRALNVVWRVEESRGFVRRKAQDVAWTLVVLALVVVTFVLIFLGGHFATEIFGRIGLGETTASVWQVARWPAALATALAVYAIVYRAAPNVKVDRLEWITPGALFGVAVWLAASALFFVYVANFGSYDKTYGTFAGAVILLVWLWLTNVTLLFGAELNAVIRLRRQGREA